MSPGVHRYKSNIPDKLKTLFKKSHVIAILLSLSCYYAFAQREKINSLLGKLSSLKDTARIDCLNALSSEYINVEKKDSASYYAALAYEEAISQNYIYGIARSYYNQSDIMRHFHGDRVHSETLTRKGLEWYKKTSDKRGIVDLYNQLSILAGIHSRYAESVEHSTKAYDYAKKENDTSRMTESLLMSGLVCLESGEYEKAFYFLQKEYELRLKIKDQTMISRSLFALGELYMHTGDYNSALTYFRNAFQKQSGESLAYMRKDDWDIWVNMELADVFSRLGQFDSAWHYINKYKSFPDPRYKRIFLVSAGECEFFQKNYSQALENFLAALPLHEEQKDRNQVMRTLIDIAKTYLELDKKSKAFHYTQECLNLAISIKAIKYERDAYQILYVLYDKLGIKDSANSYYRMYSEKNDTVLNEQTRASLAAQQYNEKIASLNREKELRARELERSATQKKMMLFAILGILLISIVLFRDILLKRKNEKQQLEHEMRLQQLESKIASQQALLNERLRIGRELHDELGATLSGIVLYSHLGENQIHSPTQGEVRNTLNIIQQSANEMVNKLNDIIWSVNPEHNSLSELLEKLEEYATEMAKAKNIKVQVDVSETFASLQLPVETNHNIYLICKEAINNAVKYSNADVLELSAHQFDHSVEVTIKDNGEGFDIASVRNGNGLRNMQKRAETIGAMFCCNSFPFKGTIVSIRCSLERR